MEIYFYPSAIVVGGIFLPWSHLMNWILLVWVITGDVYHLEQIKFDTFEQCQFAEKWTMEEGKKRWIDKYAPKAKCFRVSL